MKKKELSILQKRHLSSYEREIRKIIFKISKLESFKFIPVSYCSTDNKFQTLKIFVEIEENKDSHEEILNINKKYSPIVRNELAKTKSFSRIPKIIFEIDKYFNYINEVEKTLKDN